MVRVLAVAMGGKPGWTGKGRGGDLPSNAKWPEYPFRTGRRGESAGCVGTSRPPGGELDGG